MPKTLIPKSKLPDRYGVTRKAIWDWQRDPRLNFPKPDAVVNGREYFGDDTLDAWDKSTLGKSET